MEYKYKIGDIFSYRCVTRHTSITDPSTDEILYIKILDKETSARCSNVTMNVYKISYVDSIGENEKNISGRFQYLTENHIEKYYKNLLS